MHPLVSSSEFPIIVTVESIVASLLPNVSVPPLLIVVPLLSIVPDNILRLLPLYIDPSNV